MRLKPDRGIANGHDTEKQVEETERDRKKAEKREWSRVLGVDALLGENAIQHVFIFV